MLESQKKILDNRIGQLITSLDIVDLMNYIGKCVVAGNVRRSAEIALGDVDYLDYVTANKIKLRCMITAGPAIIRFMVIPVWIIRKLSMAL